MPASSCRCSDRCATGIALSPLVGDVVLRLERVRRGLRGRSAQVSPFLRCHSGESRNPDLVCAGATQDIDVDPWMPDQVRHDIGKGRHDRQRRHWAAFATNDPLVDYDRWCDGSVTLSKAKGLPGGVEMLRSRSARQLQYSGHTVLAPTLHRGRLLGQRGAALLEFVIIFPILMTLAFSVWEAGRIFDAWLISTNAAREGARYAVEWDSATNGPLVSYVQGKVMGYVNSSYGNRVNAAGGDVTIDSATDVSVTASAGGTGPVTVAVTAHVKVFAPGPYGSLVGPDGDFELHAWSTMYQ
jgi:Flp pilus assembly protein TadG